MGRCDWQDQDQHFQVILVKKYGCEYVKQSLSLYNYLLTVALFIAFINYCKPTFAHPVYKTYKLVLNSSMQKDGQ